MRGMASPPAVDLTSTGSGYPYYAERHVPSGELVRLEASIPPASSLPDAIEQIRAERDILRCRVEERAHDCTNVEAERDRLRRELAERDAECRAHMEMRYNAERERDEALVQVAEIKRVLIGYYCQVGIGIMSVRKLAKRLYEESVSTTELTAGATFSTPAVPSSREPLYVYRPMTQAEVEAQVEKNRWGTDE